MLKPHRNFLNHSISSLTPLWLLSILMVIPGFTQTVPSSRGSRLNILLNPEYNSLINPEHNSVINPKHNSIINPKYNDVINPALSRNL
jgi:hypothetical protein